MKRLFFLIVLVFVGVAAWRISERLSADAIGMALGVLFGIFAGIPVALLVLASARRRDRWEEEAHPVGRRALEAGPQGYAMQAPPVIVVAGPGYPPMQSGHDPRNPQQMLLQAPQGAPLPLQARQYRLVGEQDEQIDGDQFYA